MLRNILIAVFCLTLFTAQAGSQIVTCKGMVPVKLLFRDGNTVEILGDQTWDRKRNVGYLADPGALQSAYRGLTFYSELFNWERTRSGNGLDVDEVRLLVNGNETVTFEFNALSGDFRRITLRCE